MAETHDAEVHDAGAPDAGDGPVAGPAAWSRRDSLALTLVLLLAAALRVPRLGTPSTKYGDEVYYASDACVYLHPGDKQLCGFRNPISNEHPPLGKWLIGLGMQVHGVDAIGWRLAPLVAGLLTVALLYVLCRITTGSVLAATAGSGLLAVDLLHISTSRMALLDVFVTFFGVAAVLAAVLALQRRQLAWSTVAGLCVGAATASKWSGVFVLVPVLVLVLVATRDRRWTRRWLRIVVDLAVLPGLLYVLTFAGRVPGSVVAVPWSRSSWWWQLARRQHEMFALHADLKNHGNTYVSPAWSWLLDKRPMLWLFQVDGDGRYREVMQVGNPVAWWLGLAALVVAAVLVVRGRSTLLVPGPSSAGALALLCVAATYLPWFVLGISRTYTFLGYVLPVIPFLYLGVAAVVAALVRSVSGRVVTAVATAGVLAMTAFLYPVVVALPLSPSGWHARMLFRACAPHQPPAGSTTGLTPAPVPGKVPTGWCWI